MLRFLRIPALVLAAFVTAPGAATTRPTEGKTIVSLPRAPIHTRVSGTIRGWQTRDYVFRAKAGQRLSVTFTGSSIVFFDVLPPDLNADALHIGSIAGDRFAGQIPKSGIYTIRVYQMRASARRAKTGRFALAIDLMQPSIVNGVPGDGDGQGDAKIAGTNYNAMMPVSCLLLRMLVPETCQAGVIRAHAPGETTRVDIRYHGDLKRTLIFSATGTFLKSEPGGAVAVPGRSTYRPGGDATWVTVDPESYEIPDILLQGD